MVDNKDIEVNVRGIYPKYKGNHERFGRWFLIDESGDFSLDHSIIATIWLVGGGCDGEKGYWNNDSGKQCTADRDQGAILDDNDPNKGTKLAGGRSGKGGDGGYVLVMHNVKIPAKANLFAVIAESNDQTGTALYIEDDPYRCNDSGSFYKKGGEGGWVPSLAEAEANGWIKFADGREDVINKALVKREKGGEDGIDTPCTVTETINGKKVSTCYVGSSGSGGAACNGGSNATASGSPGNGAGSGEAHRSAGTDAIGYGCGGGGGATCGNYEAQTGRYGGYGKQGCIIIAYTVEQKTLVVEKTYTKKTTTTTNCNTNYATSQNSTHCCTTNDNGCGCGSSSGNALPNGVTNANYNGTLKINNMSAKELITAIQELEAENINLTKQIEVLENKSNQGKIENI